jgi:hypothetical protein
MKLLDILNETKKDMRVGLDYLQSIQSDEPFNVRQPLYHLALRQAYINNVKKQGLIPSQPEASMHAGALKGELFKGVWLTSLSDISSIVSLHYLPDYYEYESVLLKIDGTKLDPNLFSIGIEIPLRLMMDVKKGKKISRNDYYKQSDEIVYLGEIPPKAITLVN